MTDDESFQRMFATKQLLAGALRAGDIAEGCYPSDALRREAQEATRALVNVAMKIAGFENDRVSK